MEAHRRREVLCFGVLALPRPGLLFLVRKLARAGFTATRTLPSLFPPKILNPSQHEFPHTAFWPGLSVHSAAIEVAVDCCATRPSFSPVLETLWGALVQSGALFGTALLILKSPACHARALAFLSALRPSLLWSSTYIRFLLSKKKRTAAGAIGWYSS